LISVSNKDGVVAFAGSLAELGVDIISTGGTARILREAGLTVTEVSEITDFPEIMDGRVKTLHPRIHGGLLGRGDVDAALMHEHGIPAIDLLAVNLYPFQETVARVDCSFTEALENIDIGGPAMIRAAAKNHERVAVVVDPSDYEGVVAKLRESPGEVSPAERLRLAAKAFAHTATYDASVWAYLYEQTTESALPDRLPLGLTKRSDLRYGENPHQRAALYVLPRPGAGNLPGARQHQGKPLSYNNIADADAALECVRSLEQTACAIVKHANPCGVGLGATALEAYDSAYATDPTSAFGGIVAFNVEVDQHLAATIVERQFLEVIIAPRFTPASLQALAQKPNVRVLETGPLAPPVSGLRVHQVEGGLLVQDKDTARLAASSLRTVTQRRPTDAELSDALLAWQVVRFVKSNAIVYCRDGATIGIGAGQMSRVMSARIAALKAEEADLSLPGAAMASDAFFPFRDGIDVAAEYGISVVIQPGGSVRDREVIAAANEHGMAMLFTGMRHFRH
jgi:phosphoribosylaminoimidazolecarboxamide formyltransferase/IMP cyclohydrolase